MSTKYFNMYQITAKYADLLFNLPKFAILRPFKIIRTWEFLVGKKTNLATLFF
jgi:hypothetical protein